MPYVLGKIETQSPEMKHTCCLVARGRKDTQKAIWNSTTETDKKEEHR